MFALLGASQKNIMKVRMYSTQLRSTQIKSINQKHSCHLPDAFVLNVKECPRCELESYKIRPNMQTLNKFILSSIFSACG